MTDISIILSTANARYVHASLGLRYLWSNLGDLQRDAEVIEFTISQTAEEIATALLERSPRMVGFGVYVWNVSLLTRVVHLLKEARRELVIVLGGPEVSHEYAETAVFKMADYLISGEGEVAFARLAKMVLDGRRLDNKVISNDVEPNTLMLPYAAYTDADLRTRLTYVETSRGCPFRCGFCLSSLDSRVREFSLDVFLPELAALIRRGATRLKFVDRTFNLREARVEAVLLFLLEHWRKGMQVHFEIVPDRISDSVLELMARFPEGGLRLEVGVQTFNPESQKAISRVQDHERTLRTLSYLRNRTGAVIHADLIAGLPHEGYESFAAGFDRLLALGPHEIQVGILKRLKGTAIAERHDMVFSDEPPYEVIETPWWSAEQICQIKRFARYFEIYHNAGNFEGALPLVWHARASAFEALNAFFGYVWNGVGRTHGLPLAEQAELLYAYLVGTQADAPETLARLVEHDFRRLPGRKDKLSFGG